MKLSVLVSVYANDKPDFLTQSLSSIINQTLKPDEIIVVIDGPVSDVLHQVIIEFQTKDPGLWKVLPLAVNVGLGEALNAGLEICTGDLVARMDADDICKPSRFEKQMYAFSENPKLVILGTAMDEFLNDPNEVEQKRILPVNHFEICKLSRKRNPFNHPTVMFRREAVLNAGSYESMPLFEDYYLWLKIISKGYITANLSESLLCFRIGNEMLKRRHGSRYFIKEISFFWKSAQNNYISKMDFIVAVLVRTPLRLMPLSVLKYIYKTILRK